MKVVLINPPQIFTKSQVASGVTPPLGVAYLAGYLKVKGIDTHVVDALGESPETITSFRKNSFLRGLTFVQICDRIDGEVQVVGISNLFSFAYPAVEALCEQIKAKFPQIKIVLGGPHPSAMYREILAENKAVDYVVIGEGEESFLNLVKFLNGNVKYEDLFGVALRGNDGSILVTESAKRFLSLEKEIMPYPLREALPMENYIRMQESHGSSNGRWTSILSSRGCPYGCTFCSSRRTKWVARTPQDVVDEMEYCIKKWGIEEFHFEDDNMTIDHARLIQICDEIIKRRLNIKWQTPNGIRASRTTKEMLQKMKDSGCVHVTLAPESGSERVLKEIVTKGNDFNLDQLKECGAVAHKIGLKVAAYFILGLPGEKVEDVKMTIAYARELARVGVDEVGFALFIPLPGTPLWDVSKDKVKNLDWLDLLSIGDLCRAVSFNSFMTSSDLNRYRRQAYLTFYAARFFYHPLAIWKSFWNVIKSIEETKTERVARTFLKRYGFGKKNLTTGRDASRIVSENDLNAYPYDSRETLKILLKTATPYAYGNSLLKTIRLVAADFKAKCEKVLGK